MKRSCARRLAPALAALALMPALAPAAAQDAPVVLAPPTSLPGPAAAPGQPAPPPEATPATPGIQVDTLREIDAGSVGVLDSNGGGFAISMWRGTPRQLVERLLPQLPAAPPSATARELMRRLLLSAAETPEGPAAKDGPSLIAMRVDRLLAQGDLSGAHRLLRVVPARVDEEAVQRARAEVAFLLNDNAGACSIVAGRLGVSPATFWRKAQVFCQLLAADAVGAQIGTGLLQEQGVEDAPFYALARLLGGEKGVAVGGLEKPEPLHLAMMRAARVQLPPSVLVEGSPAVQRAVAQSPNADLEVRLDAAERAEARGALDTEALRQLYLSVNFTPDEMSAALSAAEKLPGPRGRALLYRAIRGQTVPSAQAEIIAGALRLAGRDARLGTAIRVFASPLAALPANGDLAWFAADAGRALYLLGATEAADTWLAVARENPNAAAAQPDGGAGAAPPADTALWPLAALSKLPAGADPLLAASVAQGGPDVAGGAPVVVQSLPAPGSGADGIDERAFERWWQAMAPLGDETRAARAVLFLSAVEALGARVGDNVWARLASASNAQSVLPAPGLMGALRRAAAGERLGETVLMTLIALGETDPARHDVRALVPMLRALRAVGLDDAARSLATEAVFGATL